MKKLRSIFAALAFLTAAATMPAASATPAAPGPDDTIRKTDEVSGLQLACGMVFVIGTTSALIAGTAGFLGKRLPPEYPGNNSSPK